LLLAGELVQSGDGKDRYFKTIRIEMYRALNLDDQHLLSLRS